MKAELRTIGDTVEVFVNGVRQSRMWGRLDLPGQNAPEKLGQYIDAGIDVYLTNVDLEWNNGWNGDDTYDYRPYEIHIDRILAVKSDIKLVLFAGYSGSAPYTWCRANEDQLAMLSNGDRLRMGSFASRKWLEDSNRAMAAFVRHFQNSCYGEHIIGINPIMYSNEWHTPASRGHPPLDDYSAPMVAHFREWLRARYEGDEAALRASWQHKDVSFETAEIPAEARRLRTDLPALQFGEKDMPVFDYEACLDEARERFIIETCRVVKEASGGTLLTCLSRREQSLAMLNSAWVDVHHGPYAYMNRKLGNVNGYSRRNLDLHGKLGVYQIDTGTHVMPRTGGDPLGITGIWPGPHRLADSEWEAIELLERDVSKAIADRRYVYWNEGGPGWMFPIVNHGGVTYGRHWFDTPAIKALIGRCKALVDAQTALRARPTAQVALVGADYQRHHLGAGGAMDAAGTAPQVLFGIQRTEFALQRSGVAYDTYTLEDFASIVQRYPVYIFANAFYAPALLREQIRGKLAAENATVVWIYAPGYMSCDADHDPVGPFCRNGPGHEVRERGARGAVTSRLAPTSRFPCVGPPRQGGPTASLTNIEALTGFRLGVEHRNGPVQIAPPVNGQPLFRDVPPFGSRTVAKSFTSDKALETWTPEYESRELPALFYCDDPNAEIMARFEANGKPGMARKQADGFTSIWIGAPEAPWQLYRNLCAEAGVHVYSETGDYLMANERFAALYCISAGPKVIHLPGACRVHDAQSEELLAASAQEICFVARAGETRSFVLDPLAADE